MFVVENFIRRKKSYNKFVHKFYWHISFTYIQQCSNKSDAPYSFKNQFRAVCEQYFRALEEVTEEEELHIVSMKTVHWHTLQKIQRRLCGLIITHSRSFTDWNSVITEWVIEFVTSVWNVLGCWRISLSVATVISQ